MTTARSVIVVGAGICGVTAALELRHRGFSVSLFDPGPLPHPDAASTDISKMIRMDYGADELYMVLMEETFLGWDAWNAEWNPALFHQVGFLIMSRTAMQPGGYEHDSLALLNKRGHSVERLNSAMLKARYPAWRAEHYPDGYYNARAGWAESGRVVGKLLQLAQAAGVQLYAGKNFARLKEQGSRVTGIILRDNTSYEADFVVIAAGAWTPTLLPELGDVMWATGQPVLHFKPANPDDYRPPRFVPWAADIANTGWYGFPANADGIVKITNHGVGRRVQPDEPRIVGANEEARFREFLNYTFPGLANAPIVGNRLCLYCDTFDGNFWIDRDPQRPNLIVAAGDSGHGFKFAPSLGKLVADVVEQKPNPYAVRFAWRARGELAAEDARYTGT